MPSIRFYSASLIEPLGLSSPETVSIVQFLTTSAIVSGIISVAVNYLFNVKDFKKRSKIKQLEHKISLYSYLIFQLDRMWFTWVALEGLDKVHKNENEEPVTKHYAYSTEERKEMFKEMTKRIEQDYPLFKQDFLKLWVNVSTLFTHHSIEGKVPELNTMLLEQYNNAIEEYKKLTGIELDRKL